MLAIVLLVVIICVLKRYRKKYKSSVFTSSSTGVSGNPMNTAASTKEQELNESALNNPTYTVVIVNDRATISEYESTSPTVPQDHEAPYDNVPY